METLALFLAVLILGAAFWAASKVLLRFSDRIDAIESASYRLIEGYDLSPLEDRLDRLTAAMAEGIAHVDRSERRVETTLRSAQSKFAKGGYEHAGVEAELESLRERDGDGGEEDGLQLVPEDVEIPLENNEPSGVPGMTVSELEQFRIDRANSA